MFSESVLMFIGLSVVTIISSVTLLKLIGGWGTSALKADILAAVEKRISDEIDEIKTDIKALPDTIGKSSRDILELVVREALTRSSQEMREWSDARHEGVQKEMHAAQVAHERRFTQLEERVAQNTRDIDIAFTEIREGKR